MTVHVDYNPGKVRQDLQAAESAPRGWIRETTAQGRPSGTHKGRTTENGNEPTGGVRPFQKIVRAKRVSTVLASIAFCPQKAPCQGCALKPAGKEMA